MLASLASSQNSPCLPLCNIFLYLNSEELITFRKRGGGVGNGVALFCSLSPFAMDLNSNRFCEEFCPRGPF